jgi:hypothetical protein
MRELHAGRLRQPLGCEVVQRAVAGRRISDHAGLGLGCRYNVAKGVVRRLAVDEVDHRRIAHQRDRHEIALQLVRDVGKERRVDGELADVRHEERVAVRRRLRDVGGRDKSVAARTVLHDELPVQALGHLDGEQARGHVHPAARRERHHDADRFRW